MTTMTSPPTKTAIITGASSGIGLALTHHLLSQTTTHWRVILADINAPTPTTMNQPDSNSDSRTLYIPTNVSSWADNATLFTKATTWSHSTRIDLFAANAGIADKESVFQHFDLESAPQEPNLSCLDVNLRSVFYALKLFIHYARKTRREMLGNDDAVPFTPKFIITSSCVGQYPFPVAPQYAASKHALVGLTRSVGGKLLAEDNIAVNAIMPGFVVTSLAPEGLVEAWPKEFVTPMSTIMRAFDELGSPTGAVAQDGKSDGVDGRVKSGMCVECSVERLFYRAEVEVPDAGQAFLVRQCEPDGLWMGAYKGGAGVEATSYADKLTSSQN